MAETRLTLEEVCALAKLATAGSARRKFRAALLKVESGPRGRNGKRPGEYALSLLPADVQLRYAEGKKKSLAIVGTAEQTLPLFVSAPEAIQPRVAIPEDLEDQARARLDAVRSLLEFRARGKQRREIRLADGRGIQAVNEFAAYVGSQQKPPVSGDTIYRWLRHFTGGRKKERAGGFAALANRPRKDKDKSRFFEKHRAGAIFIENKFLREGLSRKMSWEALCREWKKLGERGPTPRYDAARNFLNARAESLKVLAREGRQAYWSKCSPFIQRSKVPVMTWWVSDHREFDVQVRNTLFAEKKRDEPYRPWLTALYDWGSQKIVGFCLAPNPSKRTINSAIRMAVPSHGFPANFYFDNGPDYKSVRADLEQITLSEEAQALFNQYRVGITSAIPRRPRSKPIESWFARWSKRFDVLWRPTYVGNAPGNRPEDADESQKQHAKYIAGKRGDSPLPTDAEFIVATVQWISEYNNTRLETLDHCTPNERMEEKHPERNRPKINPRLLDILFSERTTRSVQRGGCVQLDRMRYEPTDESLFALDALNGRKVAILRDPYNLGDAVAADAKTLQFIGELRMQQFIDQDTANPITRDQIKTAMRRERSLRKGYAEYIAALSVIAANQGWKTEREALVERAFARTGTDNRLLAATPGALRARPQLPSSEPSPLTVDESVREFLAEESES
jgi:transposase InsO family protein